MSSAFAVTALRTLLPLASAWGWGIWLADAVGGVAGAVVGVVLGVAVLGAWLATGFAGDRSRAGRARVLLAPSVRLGEEALVALGAAVAVGVGLGSGVLAVVLAAAAAVHLALRLPDVRAARVPRSAGAATRIVGATGTVGATRAVAAREPSSTPAAAVATMAAVADQGPAEWSKRGADGSFEFGRTIALDAGLLEVWSFVWDFEEVARCIPGCEEVTEHVPHRSYTAEVRKKLGPFLVRMPLEIEIVSYEEARSIRAAVIGKDRRLRSEVTQELDVTLTGDDRRCLLRAVIRASIQGVLASVDATLIERNLDQTIGEFTHELTTRLAARAVPSSPE
ncbi:MAG: hypothetical protein JWQ48_1363 [Conexibacter sp.]|nr:hypothetical protein [Conexibacter sp.]